MENRRSHGAGRNASRHLGELALLSLLVLAPVHASAQAQGSAANYGTGASAVAQHTETASANRPTTESQSWTFGTGVIWNDGNTRSIAANVGTNFNLTRAHHGVSLLAQFNIGSADTTPTGPTRASSGYLLNARNLIVRLRYDYFLTELDALFFGAHYRNDTFAGLDLRQEYQAGYQRNFFRSEKHRFWGEVGFDYTHDNVHLGGNAPLQSDDKAAPGYLPGCAGDICNYYSGRLFLGYDNRLNEHVSLLTGVESLFNLLYGKDIRVNWLTAIETRLTDRLAMEFKFRMLFDNVPVPTHVKTDTQTTLSLVVTALK